MILGGRGIAYCLWTALWLCFASRGISSASDLPQPSNNLKNFCADLIKKLGANAEVFSDDYYERLGADKTSSADELRSRHRKLVMAFHPDRLPNKEDLPFKYISEAYEILSDAERRSNYDAHFSQTSTQTEHTKKANHYGGVTDPNDPAFQNWKFAFQRFYFQSPDNLISVARSCLNDIVWMSSKLERDVIALKSALRVFEGNPDLSRDQKNQLHIVTAIVWLTLGHIEQNREALQGENRFEISASFQMLISFLEKNDQESLFILHDILKHWGIPTPLDRALASLF